MKRLNQLRKLTPRPLSVANLLKFAECTGNEKSSYIFLSEEIPIRLANIIYELVNLPQQQLHQPSAQEVVKWYATSFKELMVFDDKRVADTKTLDEFSRTLDKIVQRHSAVVETMAHAIIEYKSETRRLAAKYRQKKNSQERVLFESLLATEELDRQLSRFLDRFFMSRIGIRLLINQHITLFTAYNRKKPEMLGAFDKEANIESIVREAYDSAFDKEANIESIVR